MSSANVSNVSEFCLFHRHIDITIVCICTTAIDMEYLCITENYLTMYWLFDDEIMIHMNNWMVWGKIETVSVEREVF